MAADQAQLEAQFDDLMVDFSKTTTNTVETEDGVTVTTTTTTTTTEQQLVNGIETNHSEENLGVVTQRSDQVEAAPYQFGESPTNQLDNVEKSESQKDLKVDSGSDTTSAMLTDKTARNTFNDASQKSYELQSSDPKLGTYNTSDNVNQKDGVNVLAEKQEETKVMPMKEEMKETSVEVEPKIEGTKIKSEKQVKSKIEETKINSEEKIIPKTEESKSEDEGKHKLAQTGFKEENQPKPDEQSSDANNVKSEQKVVDEPKSLVISVKSETTIQPDIDSGELKSVVEDVIFGTADSRQFPPERNITGQTRSQSKVFTDGKPVEYNGTKDVAGTGKYEESESTDKQIAGEQTLSEREGPPEHLGSVTLTKKRFTEGKQKFEPVVVRKTKKLEHQWGKQGENARKSTGGSSSNQNMVSLTAIGVDYTKLGSGSRSNSVPRSPGTPNVPIVNHQTVEKCAAPEITRNVRAMFETGALPDIHGVKKTEIAVYEDKGAGIFENSPSQREDVTRETDRAMEEFQPGYTRQLRESWQNKENEMPDVQTRGPVNLAEDEGCILENEPVKRDDVLRESDMKEDTAAITEKGHASSLREKFLNRNDEFQLNRGPVQLFDETDASPVVLENEPLPQRSDVVTGDDNMERVFVQRGKASNLKTYFSSQPEYQKEFKPLDIQTDGGIVLESEPIIRSDVVRESDLAEVDKGIRLEAGRSRNLASMWQNRKEEYEPKGFHMDVESGAPTVTENEPAVRDDVIREDQVLKETLSTAKGHTMNLASRFIASNEDDGRHGPKDMIKIERSEGVEVAENQPVERNDVVKCSVDYEARQPDVESGKAMGLVEQWINTNDEVLLQRHKDGSKPKWLQELENAKAQHEEQGESEDDYPQDRLDEEDEIINDHQVLIPEQHTSALRNRWRQIQEDEEAQLRKERCPEPVRFTPPREVTPPPLKSSSGYQSVQQMTFNGTEEDVRDGPVENNYSPPAKRHQAAPPQQQKGPSSSNQTMTSKTVISLKSS